MGEWQLERGITSVGTLQSNRKGIPAEIKENQRPRSKLIRNLLEKDNGILNLHLYVVKTKSSGKRIVLLLVRVPPLLATT